MDKDLIAEDKAYFNSEIIKGTVNQGKVSSIGEVNSSNPFDKTAVFDKALVKQSRNVNLIKIPIKFKGNIQVMLKGQGRIENFANINYLLMYKVGKLFKTEKVTTYPDEEYFANQDPDKKFTGMVIVRDWNEVFIKGYKYYADGRISLLLKRTPTTSVAKGNIGAKGKVSVVDAGPGDLLCTPQPATRICPGPLNPDGDFEDNGTTYCGPWIPQPDICVEVVDPGEPGSTPDSGGSGNGDGGGGADPADYPEPPSALPEIIPEIVTDSVRKCLDSVLKDIVATAALNVKLKGILDSYKNNGGNASDAITALNVLKTRNIYITELPIADNNELDMFGNIIGIKSTQGKTSPTTGNITLNKLFLDTATTLAAAATMIHELMHSYFVYGTLYATGNERKAFLSVNYLLFDRNGTPYQYGTLASGSAQHLTMANDYIESMALLLESIANKLGITVSPDPSISLKEYCKDIFWYSLKDTSGLSPTNPSRVTTNGEAEFKNKNWGSKKKKC